MLIARAGRARVASRVRSRAATLAWLASPAPGRRDGRSDVARRRRGSVAPAPCVRVGTMMVAVVGLLAILSRSSCAGAATPSNGSTTKYGTTSYDLKAVQRSLQHVLDQATLDLTARLQTGRLQVRAHASAQVLMFASAHPD